MNTPTVGTGIDHGMLILRSVTLESSAAGVRVVDAEFVTEAQLEERAAQRIYETRRTRNRLIGIITAGALLIAGADYAIKHYTAYESSTTSGDSSRTRE